MREIDLLDLSDELQQLGLAVAVDNLTHIASRELAVVANLQFVSIDVVDAVAPLQVFTEEGKTTGEDGNLVAAGLEDGHETIDALGDGQVLGNILHDADVEALQQGNTTGEALLEVNLSAHGTLGDGANLVTDAVALSQLVDALCLDECGVHIETDKATHATEHVVALEGEVDLHLVRQFHELGLHVLSVNGLATQRELDAGSGMGAVLLDALATRQSDNAVDI